MHDLTNEYKIVSAADIIGVEIAANEFDILYLRFSYDFLSDTHGVQLIEERNENALTCHLYAIRSRSTTEVERFLHTAYVNSLYYILCLNDRIVMHSPDKRFMMTSTCSV